MSRYARIESIDALKSLRTSLVSFAKKISVALDEADFDIRHTQHWLGHDRLPHWKNELRIRGEQLVKAKLELKQKEVYEKAVSGSHSSHIDEKKAVAAAQRRFDEAEDKLRKIHHWIPLLEKEGDECLGALQGLSMLINLDIPNRRAQIDQMIYALESYVNVDTPMLTTPETSAAIQAAPEETPETRTEKETAAKNGEKEKEDKSKERK
jgi:hypothetical protein